MELSVKSLQALSFCVRAGQVLSTDLECGCFANTASSTKAAQRMLSQLTEKGFLLAHPYIKRGLVYTPTKKAFIALGKTVNPPRGETSIILERVEHESLAIQATCHLARFFRSGNYEFERELRSSTPSDDKIHDGKIIVGIPGNHQQDRNEVYIEIENRPKGGEKLRSMAAATIDRATRYYSHRFVIGYPWPPVEGIDHERRLLNALWDAFWGRINNPSQETIDHGGLPAEVFMEEVAKQLKFCRLFMAEGRIATIEHLELRSLDWDEDGVAVGAVWPQESYEMPSRYISSLREEFGAFCAA